MLSWQSCLGLQGLPHASAAPTGVLAWLHQGCSVSVLVCHMPRRIIIHNFLIPGSSQVQQMLLLPLLLNKVGSKERKKFASHVFPLELK